MQLDVVAVQKDLQQILRRRCVRFFDRPPIERQQGFYLESKNSGPQMNQNVKSEDLKNEKYRSVLRLSGVWR